MGTIIVKQKPFKLLDKITGAGVAYSMRLLRKGYSGSAIRVRRSSDNTEQDIGFDANGNLDTASLLSFTGASSGFVTTWYDQSSNGRNLTQTTRANQPTIVTNGTLNLVNSRPTITHSFTNWLNSASGVAITLFANTAFTAFSVSRSAHMDSGWSGNDTNGVGAIPRLYFVTRGISYNNNLIVNFNPTILFDDLVNVLYLNTYAHNGVSTVSARRNGLSFPTAVEPVLASFGGTGTLSTNLSGRGLNASEFIMYPKELTSQETVVVEKDQSKHYSISIAH